MPSALALRLWLPLRIILKGRRFAFAFTPSLPFNKAAAGAGKRQDDSPINSSYPLQSYRALRQQAEKIIDPGLIAAASRFQPCQNI